MATRQSSGSDLGLGVPGRSRPGWCHREGVRRGGGTPVLLALVDIGRALEGPPAHGNRWGDDQPMWLQGGWTAGGGERGQEAPQRVATQLSYIRG